MTKRQIAECFQKSITRSSNILTDIWHNAVEDYLLVINDFVHHKSHDTTILSVRDVTRICRTNAKHSLGKLTCKADPELDSDRSDVFMHNFNVHDVSNTRPKDDLPMFIPPWTPETLITDDLLDLFDIPPGKKRGRLKKFYQNSEILYHYLCYYIGSERNVKLRRLFVQKKFLKNYIKGTTLEVTGSKAEGLDMKGSDTDLMMIFDFLGTAYENTGLSTANEDPTKIQYTSLDMSPGYVLVDLVTDGECTSVSSSFLKDVLIKTFSECRYWLKTHTHGPSLSMSCAGEDFDFVPTVRCDAWPEMAKEWIVRKRKFGWPSQEMINNIVKLGCFIVPVGRKTNQATTCEWRLSFSLAEKDLVFSFNHTQLLVYGLLKLILKEIINAKHEISELLCSYFLKTTLFWTIEETKASVWEPKFIMLCVHLCLERLIQFIAEENCPNFFVRINNMFAGKLTIAAKDKLLKILCKLSEQGLNWILESETMNKLMYFIKDPSRLFQLRLLRKKKDLMEIFRYVIDFLRFSHLVLTDAFCFKTCINMLWLKSLLKVPIVKTTLHKDVCHYLNPHHILNDNKMANSLQKLQLFLLCSGCDTDLSAGKLTLASWLYCNGKFKESLEFTDLALEFSKYRIFHVGKYTTIELPNHFIPIPDGGSEIDLIKTLHSFSTTVVEFWYNSCLLPGEFTLVFHTFTRFLPHMLKSMSVCSFLPEQYSHFLRFLCLYKLAHIQRSREALVEMQRVKPMGSKYEQMTHLCLSAFLRITGNMIENKTENQWRYHTSSMIDVFEHFSPSNFEDVNWFTFIDTFKHVAEFGIDLSNVLSGMSSCRIL